MSRSARIFVAIPIPEERADKLARLQKLIAPELPGAVWVEPRMFHLTLAFLGEVPDMDLPHLCRGVSEKLSVFSKFSLNLESLGMFPDPERPRVVWAGVGGEGLDALAETQSAAVAGVTAAGFPPADPRFHPHVTLGRLKPGKGPAVDGSPLLRHFERWRGGSFEVREIITYASAFDRDGPVYQPMGRAPLRGRS